MSKTLDLDFDAFLNEADSILKERENTYCKYSDHVNIYSQIITQIRYDLAFQIEIKKEVEYLTSDHVAHNIALKFARIIANPNHKDSFIDIFGYLLLYLRFSSAKIVKLTPLKIVNNDHPANKLIDYINNHHLESRF